MREEEEKGEKGTEGDRRRRNGIRRRRNGCKLAMRRMGIKSEGRG